MQKYKIERLLDRAESLQEDAMRHLDDEPHLVQAEGLTATILDFVRTTGALRRQLAKMRQWSQ